MHCLLCAVLKPPDLVFTGPGGVGDIIAWSKILANFYSKTMSTTMAGYSLLKEARSGRTNRDSGGIIG